MGYKSKYKGSEIDSLLDKAKNDYTVKQYTDYAGYNADTSRPSNTISLIQQDQSIVVGGKRYSQNAECYVGSNTSGISTTGNWFLCGEATLSAGHDVNIFGSVQQTLNNGALGLFALGLRGDSSNATLKTFQWLSKVGGSIPQLRIVINGFSVKLYCKVFGGQYNCGCVRLYQQGGRFGAVTHAKSYFKLAHTDVIIPEADVPSGTDIADVPYLLKSGGTVTGAMTFKEWVYNDKSVRNKQGEYAHIAYKTRGTAGYVKVATITINQTHADEPIYFDIMQRQQPIAKLRLQYSTTGNTNPPLNAFTYQGTSVNYYYLHQTGSSTWDLYVRKVDSWTAITVSKVSIGGYSNGYYQNPHFTITWQDELVTAVPEGSVAATKATEYVNISGNAASATKATQDGNGIVIAGNYQRVYKTSYHVTADGWYKLAFRPNTTGLLDWKDKYILVNVYSRQGGTCNASFKILYSSQGGWMSTVNNEFLCIPLTTTNYACISNVRLLSKNTGVSGNSYIELYVQLSKGGDNASTDVEISIESNISIMYLYNTATAGETDTSAYTVITRNAVTGAYGGSLAVGGLVAEKALSANKLATPRKIGFASFDGTADLSLNAIQGANVTRWTSSGTLKPNQWIRLIRMKFIQTYSCVSITLAIEDIEQHRFRGLINFTAWVGSNLTPSVNNSTAVWYSLYQADKNSFGDVTQYIRMVPIAPTDNDTNGYVDVYVMSPLSAIQYGWHIMNDRQTNNASFTLKADVTSIIDNENFPTSYKSSAFQGVLATGENVEYSSWVTKATTATNADVANKTKYPIVFKRNGASITNWFANTTFTIDIPEELLDYSAPTGIALKVPEISVANKVANKLSLTVNGSTTEYDGSAGARVSIKANCTHIVKANSSNSLGILYPEQTGHPSAVTVPISILPLEPYNSAARGLNDGDTLILHVPNSMSNPTANYVWCVKLDITKENTTDNIIPLIHGQSAGTPAFWNTSTTIPAGFYQFVYSATLGGLVYMYRNTSTT